MQDVSPSTLYFLDRPERVVGHLTTEQFVEQWTEGPNIFFEDPPNTVLSYVGTGEDTPSDAVVVLREPVLSGSSLSYSIEVLEGVSAGPSRGGHLVYRPAGPPAEPGVPGRNEPPRPAMLDPSGGLPMTRPQVCEPNTLLSLSPDGDCDPGPSASRGPWMASIDREE